MNIYVLKIINRRLLEEIEGIQNSLTPGADLELIQKRVNYLSARMAFVSAEIKKLEEKTNDALRN